ncbi:sel1 repeat family protein [Thalassomonas viridans]|uniref:Sel1 repeat family protein n=1 Tax=Thalassomonas viridans TaxID=137584 RepID=A0AAF0CDS0_9GAMM|nr:sel1 repeat family protein [Thalassomonas viridans]WDE09016.1 sel1 repeat family protein [Thalassomonas viridans]
MLKKLLISLLFLSLNVHAEKIPKDKNIIAQQERWGIIQYQKGNYKEAFEKLSELASWGYKESQYALAFMFLKGQHVQQSTLIGMGWLGVAAESGHKKWIELFEKLYNSAPKEEQVKFDKIIADYISKFGMKAQKVTCRKRIKPPSQRVILDCIKSDHYITTHDINLVESELMITGF